MAGVLPAPNVDIPTAIDMFAKKGFNSFDMAILMGTPPSALRYQFLISGDLKNCYSPQTGCTTQ
jgi:peroxidase